MIDKKLTSKLASLLYNVYEVNYLTCLAIQEMEEKAEKYDEIQADKKTMSELIYQDLKTENQELKTLHESDRAINKGLVEINRQLAEQNQILKQGIKAMLESVCCEVNYNTMFGNNYGLHFDNKEERLKHIEVVDVLINKETANKIKAMLEVVENE